MRLGGLHHITMITGDAQRTIDFYAGVLGLRLVKQTVNFDSSRNYHLYFGDELGSPGSLLTWFEYPKVVTGRAGTGMIHTLALGVDGVESLTFWEQRLKQHGHASERSGDALRLADPDGLTLELLTPATENPPLRATHPEIPARHALTGVSGARAYGSAEIDAGARLLSDVLGFTAVATPGAYFLNGPARSFSWAYDASAQTGVQGSGSVHHIAWHCSNADQVHWRNRLLDAGMHVTEVIDRSYFQSIYFREPQGILFELATTSPGFLIDESQEHLGEVLQLPAQHEHLRATLQSELTALRIPRNR